MLVRAVFFDVDDTLVDYATAASAALNRALGPDVDQAAWAALPHYERFSSGELGFEQMRVLRMVDYLAAHDRQDEAAEDLEQLRIDYLSERCESFSDVLSCLGELQQRGLVLGERSERVEEALVGQLVARVAAAAGMFSTVDSRTIGSAAPR